MGICSNSWLCKWLWGVGITRLTCRYLVSSPVQCEDRKVETLHWALRKAGEETCGSFPRSITLSLYSSSSFIGFFINEAQASIIRIFMSSFSEEVAKGADCSVKPVSKQLHLTLAHKFSPHHQGTLEHLAKSISPAQSCEWEVVLFSRDMRFAHYQTMRTLFPFEPQNPDELTLTEGDIVFVDRTQVSAAPEGWVMAVSHESGCHGLIPENYLEKVPETNTWTQHRSYKFNPSRVQQKGTHKEGPHSAETQGQSRSILIVSHGESVEQVFGKSWLRASEGAEGKWDRRTQVAEFELDPPLSSCGIFQTSLMEEATLYIDSLSGQALVDLPMRLDLVLSSPALRCIQTAHHILTEMRLVDQVKICVDWRLNNWSEHGESQSPQFLSVEELEANGYKVEISHKTTGPAHQNHTEGAVTLIVTHGANVVPLAQVLLGLPNEHGDHPAEGAEKVPALALCCCHTYHSPVLGPIPFTYLRWDHTYHSPVLGPYLLLTCAGTIPITHLCWGHTFYLLALGPYLSLTCAGAIPFTYLRWDHTYHSPVLGPYFLLTCAGSLGPYLLLTFAGAIPITHLCRGHTFYLPVWDHTYHSSALGPYLSLTCHTQYVALYLGLCKCQSHALRETHIPVYKGPGSEWNEH
ncbi:hypothetical protein XELAEV_18014504mg [Xenopus laevis]|uniref:SH3 domain-containing protein n=1 Tax=Xenopus laevis TaxID=8355 RepID=A0A974DHC9_XENLA|nr:hypothetical protein XELAEV_18014504mg [Xenopus laevis]